VPVEGRADGKAPADAESKMMVDVLNAGMDAGDGAAESSPAADGFPGLADAIFRVAMTTSSVVDGAHKGQREAKWDARLVQVKAWVVEKGHYPRTGRQASKKEKSMHEWLYYNLPGNKSHTDAHWKKLNDAFGEGWEADFKDASWGARLLEVEAWVVQHGRYPTYEEERSMYNWLHDNLPGKKKGSYTPARWKKLNGALGEGWCHKVFPVWSSSYFNRGEGMDWDEMEQEARREDRERGYGTDEEAPRKKRR
jgi:hypothetical protein